MAIAMARHHTLPTRLIFMTREGVENIPDFTGDRDEITVRYEDGSTVILVGLGDANECTPATMRSAAALGVQKAIDLKRDSVSIVIPENIPGGKDSALAIVEGALLGNYRYGKYKTEKPALISGFEVVGGALENADLRRIETICSAVAYSRDLVNENASSMTPLHLAKEAVALGKSGKLKITVLDEKEIKAKGLGLLLAVGQGSPTPPRLIMLDYTGNRSSKERTLVIGKGITFDSGGQNLKPTGHIETMRGDMAGGAAVLGIMKVLAALQPKVNVTGCIAAAHNAVGEHAFFPGDIYPSFEGKTVEVLSTDAEGRLVLADALSYCRSRCKPTRIIDLATLTGGILTALGDLVAGLFSNDDALAARLFDAGEASGERLWRLPLYREYRDSMKSDVADLRNLSKFKKGYASSITGAAFIQEFAGDLPWAHIDIAGTAWNEGSQRGEIPQYGTGFGVRLLIDFLTRSGS